MAEHQPGVGPEHGDVVGDGLGVGGPDADVDHGDAAVVRFGQMVGRHLRQPRRRDAALGHRAAGARDQVARLDEGGIATAALFHQVAGVEAELVDIELVVGEKHEVLEMQRAGRRVMRQPVQRVIDALGRERRHRQRVAGNRLESTVGDLVVGAVEVGHVEDVAQRPLDRVGIGAVDMGAFEKGEMHRDRCLGLAHRHRHAVIAHDHLQLVDQIALEQVGAGDGGGVEAGLGHVAVGETAVDLREGSDGDAHFGIIGAEAVLRIVLGDALEGVAQERRVAFIKPLERCDGFARVGETLAGVGLGIDDRFDRGRVDSLFHVSL